MDQKLLYSLINLHVCPCGTIYNIHMLLCLTVIILPSVDRKSPDMELIAYRSYGLNLPLPRFLQQTESLKSKAEFEWAHLFSFVGTLNPSGAYFQSNDNK